MCFHITRSLTAYMYIPYEVILDIYKSLSLKCLRNVPTQLEALRRQPKVSVIFPARSFSQKARTLKDCRPQNVYSRMTFTLRFLSHLLPWQALRKAVLVGAVSNTFLSDTCISRTQHSDFKRL